MYVKPKTKVPGPNPYQSVSMYSLGLGAVTKIQIKNLGTQKRLLLINQKRFKLNILRLFPQKAAGLSIFLNIFLPVLRLDLF